MDVRVSFAELSKTYDELPMFPVFDIAHYILMILQLRNDAGVGKLQYRLLILRWGRRGWKVKMKTQRVTEIGSNICCDQFYILFY